MEDFFKTSKTKSLQMCKISHNWTQSSLDLLSSSSLHLIEKIAGLQLMSFSELRIRNILKASVICEYSLGSSFIISLQPVEDKLNNVQLQLFKVHFCFFYVLGYLGVFGVFLGLVYFFFFFCNT